MKILFQLVCRFEQMNEMNINYIPLIRSIPGRHGCTRFFDTNNQETKRAKMNIDQSISHVGM